MTWRYNISAIFVADAYSWPSCPTKFLPALNSEIADNEPCARFFLSNAKTVNGQYLRYEWVEFLCVVGQSGRFYWEARWAARQLVSPLPSKATAFWSSGAAHDGSRAALLQSSGDVDERSRAQDVVENCVDKFRSDSAISTRSRFHSPNNLMKRLLHETTVTNQ